MTVSPGKYGAGFISRDLRKVKEIRKLNPEVNIGVDGGINDKTIVKAKKVGANVFTIGSYLQSADDSGKTMEDLKKKVD